MRTSAVVYFLVKLTRREIFKTGSTIPIYDIRAQSLTVLGTAQRSENKQSAERERVV